MKRAGLLVSLLALGFMSQACGDSEGTGTGGAGGGSGGGGGLSGSGGAGGAGGSGAPSDCPVGVTVGLTQDGLPHDYEITAVVVGTDGCDIEPADFMGAKLPVTFKPSVNNFSVGNLQGKSTDLMPSLGQGPITCLGTLERENQVAEDAPSTCAWNVKVESKFALIGIDVFTLDVTETQSAFTAGCSDIPTGGTCKSTYKLTFSKAATGGGGGAGGGGGKSGTGGAGGAKGGAGGA